MKKIFVVILMTIMGLVAQAQGLTLQNQEKDSTIAVIGYFCKNDTMTYSHIQGKDKIMGTDTITMSEITEEFMVVVTDSTSEGYKMELIPMSYKVEGEQGSFESSMASLIWNNMKDLHCRFTTDEFGAVQHIENWREIRDVMKKSIVAVFDTLYTTRPEMDSIMPRKQFESLLLLKFSTEEGIKEQYSELERLFGHHGLEFSMGPVESDDVSDLGYPTHSVVESYYSAKEDEYDIDGDYVLNSRTEVKMSAEDAHEIIAHTMNALFKGELSDSINKYIKEGLKEGMTVTQYEESCYYFNGWPKLTRSITEVNLGNLVKRYEYDIIEWTSRRWSEYISQEEEEGKDI